MSLGSGALKVGRGPEHFRPRKGGIHSNPVSGNHPYRQLPTGTGHTETRSVEKYSPDPHAYQNGLKLLKGREGWELEPAKVRSDTDKMICRDQLEKKQSATPAKGRRLAPATTKHHITYASGVIR